MTPVPGASARPRTASPLRWSLGLLLSLSTASATTVSCAHTAAGAGDVQVSWTVTPAPPVVGLPVLIEMRLEEANRPVVGATLRLEAHMTHPGMAPVLADVADAGGGVYRARVQLTMAGDWALVVSGSLADGRALDRRLDLANVRTAG